jgi:hypothetical protein
MLAEFPGVLGRRSDLARIMWPPVVVAMLVAERQLLLMGRAAVRPSIEALISAIQQQLDKVVAEMPNHHARTDSVVHVL